MQILTIGTTRSVSNYCPKLWTKTRIWLKLWKPLQISLAKCKIWRGKDSPPAILNSSLGSVLHITPMVLNPLAKPFMKKGFFEEEFKALGDYDFALRLISNGITSKYVPDAWERCFGMTMHYQRETSRLLKTESLNAMNTEIVPAAINPSTPNKHC